jgi:putative oxidoreductase
MRYTLFENQKDEVLLIARVLLMALFILFGWSKLTGFSGTVAYMASTGVPAPTLAALIAVAMEFFVGIAVLVGLYTRPLAAILALYTLATGLIGHHYWTMAAAQQLPNMINFYKNISIAGGLLLLSLTGAGKYSLDQLQADKAPGSCVV